VTSTIDLHVHTVASEDGELSPREIMSIAAERRLAAIAFSDHDSTASVDAGIAAAREAHIDFVPGVEMTTLFDGKDVHILGYLLDWKDAALLAACEATRVSRVEQARGRIAKMKALGFEVDFDRVMEIAAGRPPTSAILMKAFRESFAHRRDERLAPYIEGDKSNSPGLNLFLDYFSPGKPGYISAEAISSRDAIGLILNAYGVPVVAHPGRMAVEITEALVASGAAGIEVYSTNHTPAQEAFYETFARERGLVITAGSDFHGPGRQTAPLGGLRGGDTAMVDALRERHRRLSG
jgi:3',5'-nucleoside bisphosphate phosphatase